VQNIESLKVPQMKNKGKTMNVSAIEASYNIKIQPCTLFVRKLKTRVKAFEDV
jgi:hypothetical protein